MHQTGEINESLSTKKVRNPGQQMRSIYNHNVTIREGGTLP